MRRVITYGTFDLFHYGHVNILKMTAKSKKNTKTDMRASLFKTTEILARGCMKQLRSLRR